MAASSSTSTTLYGQYRLSCCCWTIFAIMPHVINPHSLAFMVAPNYAAVLSVYQSPTVVGISCLVLCLLPFQWLQQTALLMGML